MEELNSEHTSGYVKGTSKLTLNSSCAKIQMEFVPSPKKLSKAELNEVFEDEEPIPAILAMKEKKSDKELMSVGTPDSAASSEQFPEMSLLAQYDEIIRIYEEYFEGDLTEEFLIFAEHQELCRVEWLKSVKECRRLQAELDRANHEIGDFANKLQNARRLLDQERRHRRRAEEEKMNLEQQMLMARELLFNEKSNYISDDAKEKLSFLNNGSSSNSIRSHSLLEKNIFNTGARLNTINEVNSAEINSTASLLSDFSYSRSDGDIDTSTVYKMKTEEWKKPQQISKKTKSPRKQNSTPHKIVEINPTDKIVATTTLSLSKDGPITATSIIEAVPQSETESESSKSTSPKKLTIPSHSTQKATLPLGSSKSAPVIPISAVNKPHTFMTKTLLYPETCFSCRNKIRFGKVVAKCKQCRAICHIECKNSVPVACTQMLATPPPKNFIGELSEFIPSNPPLVPILLLRCINEIELRGLQEIGLYRIPGNEKEIKLLKEKLLRGKVVPNLDNVDVHVLCGVVKDFLRTLNEPLVSSSLRRDFIQSAEAQEDVDVETCLYQTISQLPQPNRDTLAYVMLHLNRVAASRYCKMPASNLAKIFGPTIVGYSSPNVESYMLLKETNQQCQVMEHLMKIPIDFWSSFVNIDSKITTPRNKFLSKISSTESLCKNTLRRKFFTPEEPNFISSIRKRKKYFGTPPNFK